MEQRYGDDVEVMLHFGDPSFTAKRSGEGTGSPSVFTARRHIILYQASVARSETAPKKKRRRAIKGSRKGVERAKRGLRARRLRNRKKLVELMLLFGGQSRGALPSGNWFSSPHCLTPVLLRRFGHVRSISPGHQKRERQREEASHALVVSCRFSPHLSSQKVGRGALRQSRNAPTLQLNRDAPRRGSIRERLPCAPITICMVSRLGLISSTIYWRA